MRLGLLRRIHLNSRVGWRVLSMFLLAAGVPIVMLAALAQRAVNQALFDRETAVLSNTAKGAGILTIDRLRLAEQALAFEAGRTDTSARRSVLQSPLAAVVHESAQGERRALRGGDKALALPLLPRSLTVRPDEARLLVMHQPKGPSALVMVRQDAGTGARWIGQVDPAFLWAGADELPPGRWLCALGPDGPPLFCSDPRYAPISTQLARRKVGPSESSTPHAVKHLFLDADFGTPDWKFVAGFDPSQAASGGDLITSVLPSVALGSALLVALLSLTQIRRTLTPLSELSRGASRMGRRELSTRVKVSSHDEFGNLAQVFNDMAGQLEQQFSEIQTLASIDRDIVQQQSLDAILGRVALRLAAVMPECTVAVGRLALPEGGPVVCLVAHPGRSKLTQRSVVIDAATVKRWRESPDCNQLVDQGPPELAQALFAGAAADAVTLPLLSPDRLFGLIAISGPRGQIFGDDDARRHLQELRNRVVVAAAAAERQKRLQHEAHHDSLTGLLNRAGLHHTVEQAMQRCRATQRTLALMFVDIDRFKSVNDSLGHAAGDEVLKDIGARLKRLVHIAGVVARPAGDEFVVLLPDLHSPHAALKLGEDICHELSVTHIAHGLSIPLGASIGIALLHRDTDSLADLMRHADLAMYEAKRHAKGSVVVFRPELDAQAQRKALVERELPKAIAEGELTLLYQPRVCAVSRRVESAEALIRWNHPTRGLCSPAEFIPIAEDSDLIIDIGYWVIDAACRQVARWRAQGITDLRVAVNLSARQLESELLETEIDEALARHGLKPADLELEITESALVGDSPAIAKRLQRLRERGLVLALDDFGTGYSSMSYLRRLPVDILKVDRSFVIDLCTDPAAQAVATAIVAMARSLNLRTVAEGVEDEQQLHLLCQLGVDELQGYYFSKPVSPDTLIEQISAEAPLGGKAARTQVAAPAPQWPKVGSVGNTNVISAPPVT